MRLARSDQRPRQRNCGWIAAFASVLDRRPSGISEPEQLRGFIERLASRIVDGGRKPAVVADAADLEQLAMAARDQQQKVRKAEVRIDQPGRERMAFEMIDRDQRLAGSEREPLAGEERDHHSADQPRPRGRGYRIDIVDRQLGVIEHALNQRRQDLDVGARRDLRNDAAVRLVRLRLPDDGLRKNAPVAGDQRRGAVVARGFKTEDYGKSRSFRRRPFA